MFSRKSSEITRREPAKIAELQITEWIWETSDLPTHATFQHSIPQAARRFLPLLNNIYALSPFGHFIDRYLGMIFNGSDRRGGYN